MQRSVIVSYYKALDFRVTSTGMIVKNRVQYGYLGAKEIQLPDGRTISFDDIEGVSCTSLDDNTVTLQISDGTEISYRGGLMVMNEVAVMEARPMPKTTAELNQIFEELYPDLSDYFFYDVLRERDMVDMSAFDRPNEGIKPLSDKILAVYHEHVENRLKMCGFQGTVPTRVVMDEVLQIRTYDRSRNFFREWFESHEWDGVPRVRTWFRDTFGATAPALTPEEEERYLGDVAEAWFVGAVSRQYIKTHHEVVPVLIGDQGIGKGLGLRYTAGNDEWFIDTSVDVKDKPRFLDSIRGRIIVELSESSQIKSSDAKALKGFISEDEDQIRKAYARNEETFVRHFVLIATSNVDNIFTDPTGNRRFFPMYCDPTVATRRFSVDRKVGQYDVEQVWAEACYMFNHGGKYHVPKKSQAISKKMQQFCTVENPNVSAITDWLDNHPTYSKLGARISRQVILEKFFGLESGSLASHDQENAYKRWTSTDKAWKKIASMRIDGKGTRGYERIRLPGEASETRGLNIVDSEEEQDSEGNIDEEDPNDPFVIMRAICMEHNCRRFGDLFPHEGISQEVIDKLLDEGYLYESKIGVYRVAGLP